MKLIVSWSLVYSKTLDMLVRFLEAPLGVIMEFTDRSGYFTGKDRRVSENLSNRRHTALLKLNPALSAGASGIEMNGNPLFQGPGTTSLIDFYQHLHLVLATRTVHLQIPETLLVAEDGRTILLYTDEYGTVASEADDEPISMFIQHCADKLDELQRFHTSELPLYVFSTANSAYKAIFSSAEAEGVWTESSIHTKLLQRYIPSHAITPSKIRLIWTRGGKMKRYLIKKRNIDALLQRSRKKLPALSRSPTFHTVIHKKEIFPLHRSTTSLVGVSSTKSRNSATFRVSFRQESSDLWSEIPTPIFAAERFCVTLREVMTQFLEQEDKLLVEVAYDVLQDVREEYYFLNAKWVKLESTMNLSPGHELHSKSLRKRFSDLMSTNTSQKIPFVDMREVKSNNVKLYMHQMNNFSAALDKEVSYSHKFEHAYENLSDVEKKLDSLIRTLSMNKLKNEEEQRARLDSCSKERRLESIIANVYSKATHDPGLKDFFATMGPREIEMVKTSFSNAFLGAEDHYIKRPPSQPHSGLGFPKRHFDRFISLFEESMKEEHIRLEDIYIVRRHLLHFRDEIEEVDT